MANKKKATKATETPTVAGDITADAGNIDKVRDLLFGAQARDFDERIKRMEERFARETAALQSEFNNRLDSLEKYVKSQFKALGEAQQEETGDREQALKELVRDLAKKSEALRKSIELTRDKLKASEAALRDSLLQESKKLANDSQRKHTELSTRMEEESRSLRDAMTHRRTLGDLLTEVGLRLKDEFELPDPS